MDTLTPAPAPVEKNKTLKGCLGLVIIFFFLVFIFKMCSSSTDENNANFTPAQKDSVARKELIEKQFDNYNGSHRKLVEYVKEGMNDPESFVHVKTQYWDFGKKIVVQMTYRGKNKFGGVVTQTILADTNIDGSIISVNVIK